MTPRITIYDGAIPMLDEIARLHHLSALAALDQAGMELRDKTRQAFDASRRSQWSVFVVNGRRVWRKTVMNPRFGRRFNFKKAGPESMSNMITSFLMAKQMTLVVAGMHKNFKAWEYYQASKNNFEGGAKQSSRTTGQVLGGSWEILQKLSQGGNFNAQTDRYKRTRMGVDTKPIGKNPFYRPRKFIDIGRANAMSQVTDIMTSKLESLIHKQINRANVRATVRTA